MASISSPAPSTFFILFYFSATEPHSYVHLCSAGGSLHNFAMTRDHMYRHYLAPAQIRQEDPRTINFGVRGPPRPASRGMRVAT